MLSQQLIIDKIVASLNKDKRPRISELESYINSLNPSQRIDFWISVSNTLLKEKLVRPKAKSLNYKNEATARYWRKIDYILGFSSYQKTLAKKMGFGSYTGYLDSLARKRGFRSQAEYRRSLIKGRGFESNAEYLDSLAKKKGFNSNDEYREALVKRRGFSSKHEYQKSLAKRKGFKSRHEYDEAQIKKRGFGSFYEYQGALAKKRGFKSRYKLYKALAEQDGFRSPYDKIKFTNRIRFASIVASLEEAGMPIEQAVRKAEKVVKLPTEKSKSEALKITKGLRSKRRY